MSELKSIEIDTFKRIREIKFDLAPVSIFVGANGSGKSSILQAIHLASCCIRQVAEIRPERPRTVSASELDYLPSDSYWDLGHGRIWGNQDGAPGSTVRFVFQENGDNNIVASGTLRSARNAGISIRGSMPPQVASLMRDKDKYFTAYIPGISGVANSENKQSKKVVYRGASYGDSNIYMRNILLQLKNQDKDNVSKIQDWLYKILGEKVKISVQHDENKDLIINCKVSVGGIEKPLELVGTGFLQLIQIFSYLYLFKPSLLLIDEPDVHLHPPVQEKLIHVLGEAAHQVGTRIIIATHSPFIVRGRTPDTNTYWLQNGELQTAKSEEIETQLGWGALGKKILIISEDSNLSILRGIVRQWPDIEQQIAFYPGNGYKNLPKSDDIKNIYNSLLGKKMKILIHRDRDALTDEEIEGIRRQYRGEGENEADFIDFWFPEVWDVESCFCTASLLSKIKGIPENLANQEIRNLIKRFQVEFDRKFCDSRKFINTELYPGGGSPENRTIKENFNSHRVTGKVLMKKIINDNKLNEGDLIKAALDGNLAMDLKEKLESLLE